MMKANVLANKLNAGFIPIRKPGKLPSEIYSQSYELEYGFDTLEIHAKAAVDFALSTGKSK